MATVPAGMFNIVQLNNALLIPFTAAFIVDKLGFKPAETNKRAVYWAAADYPRICDALLKWIEHQKRMDPTKLTSERPKDLSDTPPAAGATPTQAPPPGQVAATADPFAGAANPFAGAVDPFAASPAPAATTPVVDVSALFG